MTENENIKYKLETLASYWPEDLDYPQFEVAYEIESGEESFGTVCCIDLAEQALKRITELEANQAKLDLNKIKADAIREAVKLYKNKVFDGCDIYSDGLLDYADKLEQGNV